MATTATSPDGGTVPAAAAPADDTAVADAATTAGLIAYREEIGLGGIRSTFAASRTAPRRAHPA